MPDVQTFLSWSAVIGISILGLLAIASAFDTALAKKRKQVQEVDNNLIDSLTKKVDLLREDLTVAQNELKNAQSSITALQAENQLLKDIAIGKDGNTKQFYADAYASMKQAVENLTISRMNNEILVKVDKSIAELLGHIKTLAEVNTQLVTNFRKEVTS